MVVVIIYWKGAIDIQQANNRSKQNLQGDILTVISLFVQMVVWDDMDPTNDSQSGYIICFSFSNVN